MDLENELDGLYEAAKHEGRKLVEFSNPANIRDSLNKLGEISKEINEKEKELIQLINREK